MGNKSVVTIRFQVAGAEAELYKKIHEEKKELPAEPEKNNKEESARLPEESNDIPEGALDFLEKFC